MRHRITAGDVVEDRKPAGLDETAWKRIRRIAGSGAAAHVLAGRSSAVLQVRTFGGYVTVVWESPADASGPVSG